MAGTFAVAVAVVATASIWSADPPDATLHRTAAGASGEVRALVDATSWVDARSATLRGYGSYRGLEIWFGTDAYGSPCLVATNPANRKVSETRCAPAPADLILDVSSSGDDYDGLPGTGIIRFIYRGDTVDVFLHVLPGTN